MAGLYHVRNRAYDPELGRWTRRDPIGYVDGPNVFEYVGGRAVVGVDPTGLCVRACTSCFASIGGAALATFVTCSIYIGAPHPDLIGRLACLAAMITALGIAVDSGTNAECLACDGCLKRLLGRAPALPQPTIPPVTTLPPLLDPGPGRTVHQCSSDTVSQISFPPNPKIKDECDAARNQFTTQCAACCIRDWGDPGSTAQSDCLASCDENALTLYGRCTARIPLPKNSTGDTRWD